MDCRFEASSLDFGRRHLRFLEPEVTIFGKEGDAEGESCHAIGDCGLAANASDS